MFYDWCNVAERLGCKVSNKPNDKYICLTGHDADGKPLTEEQIRSLHEFVNKPVTNNVKEAIEHEIAELDKYITLPVHAQIRDRLRQALASLELGVVKENLTVGCVKLSSEDARIAKMALIDSIIVSCPSEDCQCYRANRTRKVITSIQSQLDQPETTCLNPTEKSTGDVNVSKFGENLNMSSHIGEANEKVCTWKYVLEEFEGEFYYETDCGTAHKFTEGNITENKFIGCPYCLRAIQETPNCGGKIKGAQK